MPDLVAAADALAVDDLETAKSEPEPHAPTAIAAATAAGTTHVRDTIDLRWRSPP